VKFVPQLSKLLYQLVHSMLLRDGKYSSHEHSYISSGTEHLPFVFSILMEGEYGEKSVRRDCPCVNCSLVP